MLIGMSMNSILSPPLNAQRNGVSGEIECSKLTVVDKTGKPAIALTSDEEGNGILLYNQVGKDAATLYTKGDETRLFIYNATGKKAVDFEVSEMATKLALLTEEEQQAIALTIAHELGRSITVFDVKENVAINLVCLGDRLSNSVDVHDVAGELAISSGSTAILGSRINIYDKAGEIRWQAR